MLYEIMAEYEQIILYEEIKTESGKTVYISATIYTSVSLDDSKDYIVLSNDNEGILKIYRYAQFDVTHLKFNRDKIDISVENKKIKLFANYFSEVPIF